MSRHDPIRVNYYDALERADQFADWLFYLGAVLSIGSLFVVKEEYPLLYNFVMIGFAVSVLFMFVVGLGTKLYFSPRAEDGRRQDFFGSAFGVNLSHEKTDGYYNNDQTEPVRRIAAQVLENSFFSKSIALRMAFRERIKVSVYVFLWIVCLSRRESDFGFILAASQAVFSEQVLAKFVRLEWLRIRFERTYENTYRLFKSKPSHADFNAMALEILSFYETSKSNAAIPLSSAIFEKLNTKLSIEWDSIKKSLKI
ncbi:hypothetical protein [Pseudomonas sp. F1002]|uniref:hypothetical protein n=1 Tax=Pseudomonas sp. F1002 TaxID=2738821 RepID=UPI0015A1DEFD|nr:hypothetical protein [Pseudomonas sp. F1002]NWB64305.1 hypothetical protein [Pseudomonas sp. F1002]